jgi:putative ABC transport system permease protein
VLGILTGFYPSWVIARFNPTKFLKSGPTSKAAWLQQSLVVMQFATSTTLAIVVLLIAKQTNFVKSRDLGLEKDNIVQIPFDGPKGANAFINDLRQIAGVQTVSLSRSAPISNDHWWNTISREELSERQSVCAIYADEDFLNTYGIELLHGRFPSPDMKVDTVLNYVVVNEKLVKALGLGERDDAIGKRFWWGRLTEVTGVVADFHVEPLHFAVSPTIIVQDSSVYSQVNVRLEPLRSAETLAIIQDVYKKHFPDGVYESVLLNDQIDTFYKTESKFFYLLMSFTLVAIVISCMGLWGIASFVTLRRVKEVSIRKIVGASVLDILSLFIRQFLKPVVIAQLLALPLSWYLIDLILSNYAFKIEVNAYLFILPLLILTWVYFKNTILWGEFSFLRLNM